MGQRGVMPSTAAQKRLKGETRPSRLGMSPASGLTPPMRPGDLTPQECVLWDSVLDATSDTRHIGRPHGRVLRQFVETSAALDELHPKGTKEYRELAALNLALAKQLLLTPATSGGLPKAELVVDPLAKYGVN